MSGEESEETVADYLLEILSYTKSDYDPQYTNEGFISWLDQNGAFSSEMPEKQIQNDYSETVSSLSDGRYYVLCYRDKLERVANGTLAQVDIQSTLSFSDDEIKAIKEVKHFVKQIRKRILKLQTS